MHFYATTFLLNQLPRTLLDQMSLLEVLFLTKSGYHFLRTFGRKFFPLTRAYNEHKFDFKSIPCVMLGITPIIKGVNVLPVKEKSSSLDMLSLMSFCFLFLIQMTSILNFYMPGQAYPLCPRKLCLSLFSLHLMIINERSLFRPIFLNIVEIPTHLSKSGLSMISQPSPEYFQNSICIPMT